MRNEHWADQRNKLPWRDYLTAEEAAELARAEEAKKVWLALNQSRVLIQNRATQRAKYALQNGCSAPEKPAQTAKLKSPQQVRYFNLKKDR